MKPIQRRVYVSGVVQGVGFRASTIREVATHHPEVKGYVKNLPDGRVEAVFSGPAGQVLAMVAWCEHGPSSAQVENLELIDEPVNPNFNSFDAR